MANSVQPDQTAPIGAVCSGSTLFASILNSSVMLGNYLQQTTSAEDIFRCIFFLALKGLIKQIFITKCVCSKITLAILIPFNPYPIIRYLTFKPASSATE